MRRPDEARLVTVEQPQACPRRRATQVRIRNVFQRYSPLPRPSGGHVERGEDPAETVRRECAEELGVEARFHEEFGATPLFLTITESNGPDPHRDVALWYVLAGDIRQTLEPDPREYRSVRWWPVDELRAADASLFEPHLRRMLDKLDTTIG